MNSYFFFSGATSHPVPGRLTVEVPRSLTDTHIQPVGLLWTSDQPVAVADT